MSGMARVNDLEHLIADAFAAEPQVPARQDLLTDVFAKTKVTAQRRRPAVLRGGRTNSRTIRLLAIAALLAVAGATAAVGSRILQPPVQPPARPVDITQGALEAGTAYRLPFDPPLLLTFPAGWAERHADAGVLVLQPEAAYRAEPDRYKTSVTIVRPLRVFETCTYTSVQISQTRAAIMDWLRRMPGVSVSSDKRVMLGALDAVRVRAEVVEPCIYPAVPGRPINPTGRGSSAEIHVFDLPTEDYSLVQDWPSVLYIAEVAGGPIVIAVDHPIDVEAFDRQVRPILNTLRVEPTREGG